MKRVKNASAGLVTRRPALTAATGMVLAITLILLGLTQAMPASASSGHLFTARSMYPHIVGSRLDTCSLCHTPYLPLLNYYGLTLWAYQHDFKMLEPYDSDGDGWSNLDEIMSLTNPGDPFDRPGIWTRTPVPTATPPPTDTPQPTDTPAPTEPPGPTDTPVPTEPPGPTDTPVPTEPPGPTDTPVPTEPPGPTDTPVPTEPPGPTDTPQPTDTPVVTPTPEPTTSPVPAAFVDVTGPASVNEGEEFEVSVVVRNVAGLYGGQIRLTFDPVYLQAVGGSLLPGGQLSPSLVGLSSIDNATGQAWFVVSRQGDQDELGGDVTLATIRFTAAAAVQNTSIGVDNVLLGNKAALNIPVGGTDGLTLSIISSTPETALVLGQVTLQGRAFNNNDGAQVAVEGTSFTATTDGAGNFMLQDLAPGTYNFSADAAGYLPAQCVGKAVAAPQTVLLPVELAAGDVNDDGLIEILDAVAIGAAFGNQGAGSAADVNDDGTVNVLDLILVAANFGKGPSAWAC